jgi:hypothetical protein
MCRRSPRPGSFASRPAVSVPANQRTQAASDGAYRPRCAAGCDRRH